MIIAVKLYIDGQPAYFITYICLISVIKIIILLCRFAFQFHYLFIILGFFDLEFISIFFTKSVYNVKQKIFHYGFILTVFFPIQFLFFYCFGILENSGINEQVKIFQFLNYIILTAISGSSIVGLIPIIQTFEVEELANRIFIMIIFLCFGYSYSLMIISLTFFDDSNGINLGYYCLMLIPLNQIVLLIVYFSNRKLLRFPYLQAMFFTFIGFNFIATDYLDIEFVFGNTLSFFNSTFGIHRLGEFLEQEQNSLYGKIKYSIVIISIISSLIYILIHFILILRFLIFSKNLKVFNTQDLERVNTILNKKDRIKIYRVYLQFEENDNALPTFISINNLSMLLQQILQDEDQKLIIQFWKAVSQQMQYKNSIYIYIEETNKLYMNLDILSEVENIHSVLLSQLKKYLKLLDSIDHLIIQRLEKGLINQSTMLLFRRKNIGNKDLLMNMIGTILSINLYYKKISNFMLSNPNILLYDLYDE